MDNAGLCRSVIGNKCAVAACLAENPSDFCVILALLPPVIIAFSLGVLKGILINGKD